MALDIQKYTQPVSKDLPCGKNLEFNPLYLQLEELATGKPQQEMSNSIIPGTGPNWNELRNACLSLFDDTRDLRVAIYLTIAELCINGIPGFRDGISIIYTLIDKYWDQLWPALDPEDDFDPIERINILLSLSSPQGIYKDPMKFIYHVQNAPLTSSRQLGVFSLRNIMIATGELEDKEEKSTDLSIINAAVLDTPEEMRNEYYDALLEIEIIINNLSILLENKVGTGKALSFDSLLATIKKIKKFFNQVIPITSQSDDDIKSNDTDKINNVDPEQLELSEKSGCCINNFLIKNRSDAIAALDKICYYFENSEPNSPIPFMLRRATKIAQMNYIELVKELSPDGINQTSLILGIKEEQ